MGYAMGMACGCCACAVMPPPFQCYYAKVTIGGITNSSCSDCTSLNGIHKLRGASDGLSFSKFFGSSAAQADCTYPTCATVVGSSNIQLSTLPQSTSRVARDLSISLRNSVDGVSTVTKTMRCNGGSWSTISSSSSGANPPCDLSGMTVNVEFVRDEPCFCDGGLDWMFYSPSFTKASSKIDVTLTGTSRAVLNATNRVDFLLESGASMLWTKSTPPLGGNFTVELLWKQGWGTYANCSPFNETTATSCRIYHTGAGDIDFRMIGGVWTPVGTTTGSVVSIVFV